jgi:uroporphyrinogen decarboxylase
MPDSRDRVLAAAAGRPTDRLPVAPYVANWAARAARVPLARYCRDGATMARVHVAAFEQIGYDVVFPDCDNYYLAEGFGCRTTIPDDNIPSLERPAVDDIEQVFDLAAPDPRRDGRMPVILEAITSLRSTLGYEAAIRAPGTGPFALASYLIGMEAFLLALARVHHHGDERLRPAIEHMLDITTEGLIRFGLAEIEAGADIVQCGDSLASCDVISPAMYERWVLPRHRRVFAAWKAAGAVTALHICGDNTRALQLHADTGADIVAIDHRIDLAHAKREIGDRACLIGNLDPVETMRFGSAADVTRRAEACTTAASTGGRYILGTGCEVPVDTPPKNLQALAAVARRIRG